METTVIRLTDIQGNSPLVVQNASFEEAFGDYSEARGRGRARREKRREARAQSKIARQERKDKVKEAKQTRRSNRKERRQQMRIDRRAKRKGARQDIRANQQEARMGRRQRRLDMRQERTEARETRRDTKAMGEQGRENLATEQELYRDNLMRENQDQDFDTQGGGDWQGGEDTQGGGDWQGGEDTQGGGDWQGGGNDYANDGDSWDENPYYEEEEYYEEEGAFGDEDYESPYVQEETEFGDDSYFNVEGMDGKGAVVPQQVADTVSALKNNQKAYKELSIRRNNQVNSGAPTRGLDIQLQKCYERICELKSRIDGYCNADGNPNERKRRKKAVGLALGLRKRKRKLTPYGGSEVPVSRELNPEISNQRIEIPATSNFDAYSDLGRPVIIDGVTQSDAFDYSSDLLMENEEPTTIQLYSNMNGNSDETVKSLVPLAIGITVGAVAIYLAKRKGWI